MIVIYDVHVGAKCYAMRSYAYSQVVSYAN